jgi:cytochrome c oxidase subunit I
MQTEDVTFVENEVTPERFAQEERELERVWKRPPGLVGWLSTTHHKDIALRYIVTAFVFFGLAGILAFLMRLQLSKPENTFLSADLYNQFFTVHGSSMMFLFAVPIMEGFGMYFVPLMVGTRNVAFPRMNAAGYWIYLAGGLLLYLGLFMNVGADNGWFSYVPLAGPEFAPGKRADFWAQMITFTEISALIGAVELIATIFKSRAPGMSLNRMPLFVWSQLVSSFMILFAMPAVMVVSSMLMMDRMTKVSTHFFNIAEGGDPILYQHLFWFFGHPEVYIIFIPATGMVSSIIETFSRRKIFGYPAMVLSLISIAFIGFGLWVHHMFATPVAELGQSFFTAASMMIAIPNGIQMFCWLATLWGGKPQLKSPLLFAGGFIAIFVMGGLTGVMLASIPNDIQLHDTFFVVAHFHYVLVGGAVFPLFGALHLWFPKWSGRMLSEGAAKISFWLMFVGFNLIFFPMHILGLEGMPRRIYTYPADSGWAWMNQIALAGAILMTVAVLIVIWNVAYSWSRGTVAGRNPWGAPTLEWDVPSPPPDYNWVFPPIVHHREPLWNSPNGLSVITGLSTRKREILCSTIVDAIPEHKYELPGDSMMPFMLFLAVTTLLVGSIWHPYMVPIGAIPVAIVFAAWFWYGTKEGQFREDLPQPGAEDLPPVVLKEQEI